MGCGGKGMAGLYSPASLGVRSMAVVGLYSLALPGVMLVGL